MLNLAVEWEMLERSPANRIQLFNEDNKVEHYLDEDQLERLLAVLRTDENRPVCLIALLLISTGCRLNEVLTAKWQQIDRANRVFRIEALLIRHTNNMNYLAIAKSDCAWTNKTQGNWNRRRNTSCASR
jgi:integrase